MPPDTDLVLSDREMSQIVRLVYDRSGITLHDGKKPLVVARLQKRLKALSLDSFSEYLTFVDEDRSGDELVQLLDAIAIKIDGPKAWNLDLSFAIVLTDLDRRFRVTLRNGVVSSVRQKRQIFTGFKKTTAP